MLPLSHVEVSNTSNTVVKCFFTSSIQHMTSNNESHQVGHFFTNYMLGTKTRTSNKKQTA